MTQPVAEPGRGNGSVDPAIRPAVPSDVPAILAIHNDVVATTTAIYDEHASTLAERHAWFDDRVKRGFPVLAYDIGGILVGYSSFGDWRARWGYRHSVEHSVHVRRDHRGKGVGSALVRALFPHAERMGIHAMMGHIDASAAASLGMHRKLGFEVIGTYREVGRMHDRWLDLVAVQRLFDWPA